VRPSARGCGLVDLVVGTFLGFFVLTMLVVGLGSGGRLLANAGQRGEAEDTTQLAVEAFAFDARRAGFDPAAVGVERITQAQSDRVTFTADLDGDGLVDATSEEKVAYLCNLSLHRLSRIVGSQSLPVADDVIACALRYVDAAGTPIPVPVGGLAAADRARAAAVVLDVSLEPANLTRPVARTVRISLRR
jgi:Tfp pilus assembly protein PilW